MENRLEEEKKKIGKKRKAHIEYLLLIRHHVKPRYPKSYKIERLLVAFYR